MIMDTASTLGAATIVLSAGAVALSIYSMAMLRRARRDLERAHARSLRRLAALKIAREIADGSR